MTSVNGHTRDDTPAVPAMVPFAIPPRVGPASAWTPPGSARPDIALDISAPAAPVKTDRGDRLRRASMWVLASGVAAIAAIVSYSHIYDLGRAHGGSGVPARLLPLSVDMLILVGELMLLHEADGKGRRFVLGWVLIWSGILATLAANVAYGAAFGLVGAIIWGWPAYSFILAAGGMVAVVKRGVPLDIERGGEVDIQECAELDMPVAAEVLSGVDIEPVTLDIGAPLPVNISVDRPADKPESVVSARPRTSPKAAPRAPRRALTAAEKVAAVLRDNPEMSNVEAAKRAGVSAKTVQRTRPQLASPDGG